MNVVIEYLKAISPIIIVPMLRSVAGWAVKALEDNKIEAYEWKQLGSTIVRVGFIGFATYYGLGNLGFEVDAIGAAFSAVLIDMMFGAIKKKK